MKKKVLTVLLTGAMVASMAAGATVVSAEDNDNTLTVWAWDQNFNIKSMQIAADQYAADHEGFSVDIIETSSDDCQTKLTTAANAGDYSTLPDIVLMQDNSYQKFLKAYPDAFTDLKDMNVNWDDFGALKQSYSMVDDTHYGVPFDNGAVIACYGLCNKESSGIIKKLDRSYLILFIHESYRLAYKLHGFLDETIQKIVDTVSDLLRFFFFVLRGDQIIKGTVDQGQLGDVVVDAEYIVEAAVIVLYI